MKQKQIGRALAIVLALIMGIAGSALAQSGGLKQRAEIDAKYKWVLADLYPSDADWQKQYTALKARVGSFDQFRGHLADSPALLAHCLHLRDSINILSDNLGTYAYLRLDEDNRVGTYQEMADNSSVLGSQLRAAQSFIEPELLAMDGAKLAEFVKSEPLLTVYRFYLDGLVRSKMHILSREEEALLANAGPVLGSPGRIFGMIDDADLTFGTIKDENGQDLQISKEGYTRCLHSPDRRVRREAAEAFDEGYLKHANGLAAALASSVKKDYFLAQTRKYNSCLEASLDYDSIPPAVFYSLIDAVNANLAPLHKWAGIRKRILGIDTLYGYDLYAPLTAEIPKTYTWEEAGKVVLDGLAPMGKQYQADFAKGLNGGWLDVYETPGKGSGAYCSGTFTSHPFVLMNFNGTLSWVFTLAHEMGHAMNSYYSNQHEPYIYSNQSLFTAEVASTCNEAVLMKYLIDHTTDRKEKMILLTQYIEQIVGTFYNQVLYSEFELAIHKRVEAGEALSLDFFRKTYRDILQKYWGPELVIGPLRDLRGIEVPHFYRQYYVFQYATSYAASQALSQRILDKEKGALDQYLNFLKTGSSKYPVTILKDAGVDMTTPDPVNRTCRLFASLVDEMEKLLNEK